MMTESDKQKRWRQLYEAASEEMYLHNPTFKGEYGSCPLSQYVRVIKRTDRQVQIIAKYEILKRIRYCLRHISRNDVAGNLDKLTTRELVGLQLFSDEEHYEAWYMAFHANNRKKDAEHIRVSHYQER